MSTSTSESQLPKPEISQSLRQVGTIWAEALQREGEIGSQENFFDLGGDSLAMMIVVFRVNEEFGIELPEGVLLEAPSLESFCMAIDTARRSSR